MTEVKLVEIRDRGTLIPAFALRVTNENDEASYLLRRAGWQTGGIFLGRLDVHPESGRWDPYGWPRSTRTMAVAHLALSNRGIPGADTARVAAMSFDVIQDGGLVDVEWILGERSTPKSSERVTHPC